MRKFHTEPKNRKAFVAFLFQEEKTHKNQGGGGLGKIRKVWTKGSSIILAITRYPGTRYVFRNTAR